MSPVLFGTGKSARKSWFQLCECALSVKTVQTIFRQNPIAHNAGAVGFPLSAKSGHIL
jgi:hypothetical protein